MNSRPFTLPSLVCLFAASVASLAGCAADASSEPNNGDAEVAASEDAITGAPSNFGYFVVTHRDLRKCASPMCGGFFVKRVNQAKTACADGSQQDECYVSAITYAGIGLSTREEDELRAAVESGQAVIKAATYKKKFGGQTIGSLKANEGWVGATGSAAEGTFYRAADNGIRCITAPCPSTTAFELNGHDDHNVIDVNLASTTIAASADILDRASQALGTKEGILVAGGVAIPKCVPGSSCGPLLIAQEFFVRVIHTENTGCGGHRVGNTTCNEGQFCTWTPAAICGAADAGGTCQYKPELCPAIFNPVCACDGTTYSNECVAARAGTSVSSLGACAK
jgi:hypothetical protein